MSARASRLYGSFTPMRQACRKLLSRQKAVLLQSGREPKARSTVDITSPKLACAAEPCTEPIGKRYGHLGDITYESCMNPKYGGHADGMRSLYCEQTSRVATNKQGGHVLWCPWVCLICWGHGGAAQTLLQTYHACDSGQLLRTLTPAATRRMSWKSIAACKPSVSGLVGKSLCAL